MEQNILFLIQIVPFILLAGFFVAVPWTSEKDNRGHYAAEMNRKRLAKENKRAAAQSRA